MAGRGYPADPKGRRAIARGSVKIAADGKLRGPALPRWNPTGDGKTPWHPRTKIWWDSWRRSPQAVRMPTAPDWESLLEAAVIHDHIMKTGDMRHMPELRLREAKFGMTPADRAQLNVEVGPAVPESAPSPGGGATVSSLDEARDRQAAEDRARYQRVIEQGKSL